VEAKTFVDTTAPDDLYIALEPTSPPTGTGDCARHNATLFDSPQRQQAAFDGEPVDPAADYEAALAVCLRCPLLPACQRYADASREPFTFLAGMTAAERRARHTKKTEIAKRRQQVDALRALGAPTGVIAEILGRDSSLIRGDIRTLDQSRPTAA
jgi:hypothetical protein